MTVEEFAHLFDEYTIFIISRDGKSLEKISNTHINESRYKNCIISSARHRSTFINIILDGKRIKK